MRTSEHTSSPCRHAAALLAAAVIALGFGHVRLAAGPALAFDGTTTPSTALLTPSDGLRGPGHDAGRRRKSESALPRCNMRPIRGTWRRNGKSAACMRPAMAFLRTTCAPSIYFSQIANTHPDETPGTPQARFVANAFVALGHYYLTRHSQFGGRAGYGARARNVCLCRVLFRRRRRAVPARPALSRRHAERCAPGGALAPACRDQGRLPRRSGAWRPAVPGPEGAPAGRARSDVAHAQQRLRRRPEEVWVKPLYDNAFRRANDDERAMALVYLDTWLKGRRE